MRPQNPKALLLICAVFLCACKEELGFEEGYDDGYAVGYNTTCEIRTTAVHGAWDNKAYKSGLTTDTLMVLQTVGPNEINTFIRLRLIRNRLAGLKSR